ncbi:hypothetical protein NPIL_521111 [Nephila pilipes]|uniref:Uncharacterized protein n=1 Tax=Nephila pilipes TaxID=299642 RepID=A0A8X6TIZ1_NEPPI|nr:hypothetical protein NPIL_521111 [Nephila pilipes]
MLKLKNCNKNFDALRNRKFYTSRRKKERNNQKSNKGEGKDTAMHSYKWELFSRRRQNRERFLEKKIHPILGPIYLKGVEGNNNIYMFRLAFDELARNEDDRKNEWKIPPLLEELRKRRQQYGRRQSDRNSISFAFPVVWERNIPRVHPSGKSKNFSFQAATAEAMPNLIPREIK